jgi:hypothetical protein
MQLFYLGPDFVSSDKVIRTFSAALSNPALNHDSGLDSLGDCRDTSVLSKISLPKIEQVLKSRLPSIVGLLESLIEIHRAVRGPEKNIFFYQVHNFDPHLARWANDTLTPDPCLLLIRNPVHNFESVVSFALSRPSPINGLIKLYKTLSEMAVMARLPGSLRRAKLVELERVKSEPAYRRELDASLGFQCSISPSYFGLDYVGPPSYNSILSAGFSEQLKRHGSYVATADDLRLIRLLFNPIYDYSTYEPPSVVALENLTTRLPFESFFRRHFSSNEEFRLAEKAGMKFRAFCAELSESS